MPRRVASVLWPMEAHSGSGVLRQMVVKSPKPDMVAEGQRGGCGQSRYDKVDSVGMSTVGRCRRIRNSQKSRPAWSRIESYGDESQAMM